jgi:pyridoxal phosphate enzyme (YggS family)
MAETAHALTGLSERLDDVRGRIAASARRCNRSLEEITLVAVTKTHGLDTLKSALALGLTDLGENRVQEAEPKILALGRNSACWHLVGHLQANKARRAVNLFDVIHSIDSTSLAQRLDRLCAEEGRAALPVLIQVDLAGEETKSGVNESGLDELAETIAGCDHLQLTGLMTLPPFFEDAERARPFFKRLRELRDGLRAKGHFGDRAGELSMGMTHDFEIAIEEGATMVRVGTVLFGERQPNDELNPE